MLVLTFTILPFGVLVLLLADPRRHQTANPTPRPPIEKVSIFEKNVDLALTLAMGTFTENPCARMTIL